MEPADDEQPPAATSQNARLYPWPCHMRAVTAAAYCDEVSERAFLHGVAKGLYPKPTDVPGKGHRWLKKDLKAAVQRLHGKYEIPLRDLV